jgi:hypothetical protein
VEEIKEELSKWSNIPFMAKGSYVNSLKIQSCKNLSRTFLDTDKFILKIMKKSTRTKIAKRNCEGITSGIMWLLGMKLMQH